MKKRMLWLTAILSLVLLIPLFTFAQSEGDIEYRVEADGSATVVGYRGTSPDVVIPSTLGGARVTSINSAAFLGNENLVSVVLPEGIVGIGNAAFKNARSLQRINLPNTLTVLGESVFENCYALQSVVVPVGIQEIKDRTFQNCKSLVSLALPDSIHAVGLASFSGLDSLREFSLPKELQKIGMGAFAVSNGIEKIIVPASVEEIGYSAFHGCQNLKTIVLPIGMNKVVGGMFYDCPSLETVAFPASIRTVDTSMLFTGSSKVSIWGFSGSTAQGLAKTLSIPFTSIEPVRGIELTYAGGMNVADQMVGIDLASDIKTLQLSARITQETPWPLISWKSSQPSVATVDQNGLVTGLKSGTVKITASATDGNGHSVSTDVNVAILVKSVTISGEDGIVAGKRTDLAAAVAPENADNRSLSWASSNESAATVNKNGRVSAKKVDANTVVEITASSRDGSGVVGKHFITIYPVAKSISLTSDGNAVAEKAPLGIDLGSNKLTLQLKATVLPLDAKQEVSYTSSSPNTMHVSEAGLVTALKKGSANITVRALDGTGVRAVWRVNAATLVRELQIEGEQQVVAGKSILLKAAALPEEADDKRVNWSSSNPEIAEVKNGKVTAKRNIPGVSTIQITATATDGSGVQASYPVTVYPIASSIVVSARSENLMPNSTLGLDINATEKTIQLVARVEPEGALQNIIWKSSHPRHVTVDESGLVTAVSKGQSTITVTADDGSNRKIAFKVKVSVHAQSITLSTEESNLKPGASIRISATFAPEDVTSKALAWTSSDEKVATVDQRGNVKISRQIAEVVSVVISATAKDGSLIAASITLSITP